jgi:hypothetical protein
VFPSSMSVVVVAFKRAHQYPNAHGQVNNGFKTPGNDKRHMNLLLLVQIHLQYHHRDQQPCELKTCSRCCSLTASNCQLGVPPYWCVNRDCWQA